MGTIVILQQQKLELNRGDFEYCFRIAILENKYSSLKLNLVKPVKPPNFLVKKREIISIDNNI